MTSPLYGFRPVIIGYGRAGRDLHHASLNRICAEPLPVYVIDTQPQRLSSAVTWLKSLRELPDDPTRCVFHVTTPVFWHRMVVEELADIGATHIIVEKPLAPTATEARRIAKVATVLPVGVWPASNVTSRIRQLLSQRSIGDLLTLHCVQSKPRFTRSVHNGAHRSATEVELPHQVLLARYLAGPIDTVKSAVTWPLPLPDGISLPAMGGVVVELLHTNGVRSTLLSDLTSPVRTRSLTLTGTEGGIEAHFPLGEGEEMGQVRLLAAKSGNVSRRELIQDAPLTQFLAAAYASFAGVAPPPADLNMHVQVAEVLESIAAQALNADKDEVLL